MNRNSCVGCGGGHSLGYLFGNPANRICNQCRSIWLTFLDASGFVMDNRNDLINELCEDSHYAADSQMLFYNSLTQQGQRILRLRK